MIVLLDPDRLASLGRVHGHDLVLEHAARPRARGRLLAAQRVGVHVLARDGVPPGQVVGGLRHVEAAVRVEERHHQRVLELPFAEAQAGACAADDVRRLRHVLHAAGEGEARLAQADHLGGRDHGLDPRAAQAIHGQRGHLDGQAGLQPDVPGAVDRIAGGLQGVAHDDGIDPARLRSCALERGRGRFRAQFDGGDVLERAHVLGHGRARAAHDHDFVR